MRSKCGNVLPLVLGLLLVLSFLMTSMLRMPGALQRNISLIANETLFMSDASLLAEAVAKKASVEIVRIAMNFDFMILPMIGWILFLHPFFSKNCANYWKLLNLHDFRRFCLDGLFYCP